jgi:hypothetical protein
VFIVSHMKHFSSLRGEAVGFRTLQQAAPAMPQRVNLWMVLHCTKATEKCRRERPHARPLDVTLPLLPTSQYYTYRHLIPLFAGMSVVIST